MIIAIASKGDNLECEVAEKLGFAPYLIIIDLDTMKYHAFKVSQTSKTGVMPLEPITIAFKQKATAILAGYVSPRVSSVLIAHGIEVISGIKGKVKYVADTFKVKKCAECKIQKPDQAFLDKAQKKNIISAFKKTTKQFLSVIPILIGVILLIGLFQAFINKEFLFTIFTGSPLSDTILGASAGSILIGNPINSYIIGDTLRAMGVSLYAVTALMVSWVTVGLIQLPAEIAVFGSRFAIGRNIAQYLVSMLIASATVLIVRLF